MARSALQTLTLSTPGLAKTLLDLSEQSREFSAAIASGDPEILLKAVSGIAKSSAVARKTLRSAINQPQH
jgi:hypothetical protein